MRDQYLIKTELGQELIDHTSLFLSKRAVKTFSGYAGAQLRRLQNALARDSMPQEEREQHILRSVQNALEDFERRYGTSEKGTIRLYIDQAQTPGMDREIFVDADYRHLPLREYNQMFTVMTNVVRDYDKIGKRNKKKDDNHLNKHAMHLIRLFMMAIDILEEGEIRTYRAKEQELLLDIRNGKYQRPDGLFREEFYELLADYEKRLHQAAEGTSLPEQPDRKKVQEFVMDVNERVVRDEI